MGYEDCVGKIIADSEGEVSKEEAKQLLEDVVKRKDSGLSQSAIAEELLTPAEKVKQRKAAFRRYNLIRDFDLRKQKVDIVMSHLEKGDSAAQKVLSKLGYKSKRANVKEGLYSVVRNFEQWSETVGRNAIQDMETKLLQEDLLGFMRDNNNSELIEKEIAALSKAHKSGIPSIKSVTGSDKAYRSAQLYFEQTLSLHERKGAAGSTIGFNEDFITSNLWQDMKVQEFSDDEFYEIMKDVVWGDDVRPKEDWIEFKQKILANEYSDFADELSFGEIDAAEKGNKGTGSLAELSGLERRIKLTPEQYHTIASKFFIGDSLYERMMHQITRDARVVSQLEYWGSNPRQQFRNIVKEVKSRTKADPEFINKKGGHFLNDNFHSGDGDKNSILERNIFGDVNKISNHNFSDTMELIRDIGAVGKLAGATITAFNDFTTRGVRISSLLNKEQPGEIFAGIAEGVNSSLKQFGKVETDARLRASMAGVNTGLDELQAGFRFDNAEEVAKTGKNVRRVRQGLRQAFSWNQLENFTNMNLRASYTSASNIYHSYRNFEIPDLAPDMQRALKDIGITDAEWNFIRSHAVDANKHGDGLLSIEKLEDLPLDEYRSLFPETKTDIGLRSKKRLLKSKWQTVLLRESKTMTLMPDIIDRSWITRGYGKGTIGGESARTILQFKSFASGYTRRILLPMLMKGTFVRQAEFVTASLSMAMLTFWMKDLVAGRSPRDPSKPENVVGAIGMMVGLPFIDQVGFAMTSDNPQESQWYEIAAGPALSDVVETATRFTRAAQDIFDGEDPELDKEFARTFLPALPFRNFPGLSIPYNMMYNNYMESRSPGFKQRARERLKERGSVDLTGTL